MADAPDSSGRDARGRFGLGNPGGPGGSRRRTEVRRAIENATPAEHIEVMFRKALRMGLEGSLQAMRIVLEHTSGRPAEAPLEPEVLDLRIPDMNTPADCGDAIGAVLAGITGGKVDRKTGKVLLDGINTRMQAIQATAKEQPQDQGQVVEVRPVPDKVLQALFQHFKRTGQLPDDVDEAGAVVEKVKAGYDLVEIPADGNNPPLRSEFVKKARAEDKAMDALLDEAVYAPELARICARFLLAGIAKGGGDVTSDPLRGFAVPEYGWVGTQLVGFPERFVRRPYKVQARRLLRRIEAARANSAKDQHAYRLQREREDQAATCFQFAGERPDDPLVLQAVLLAGEFMTLIRHIQGEDVSDAMRLFDKAARTTGVPRDQAIAELQEMAKSGRLVPA